MIGDFAPYAFFCARANFLWAIGLTNTQLFKPKEELRKNDRKDLEYCYYLPHCEIFASKDNIHKMLVPYLLRPDQSFVNGEILKTDLRELSQLWEKLSQEEKINYHSEKGYAPPENKYSVVFNLWEKHRNEISKPFPLEILQAKVFDSSKPKEEQVEMTFGEMLNLMADKMNNSENLSSEEIDEMRKNNPDISGLSIIRNSLTRCLVPECDGDVGCTTQIIKETLWDKFYMGAPQRQRRFAEQYKIVKKA